MLDPADVEARITHGARAVVAVHFAGYAAPVGEPAALCVERGVALRQDAAHAPVGGSGEERWELRLSGVLSFFSNKVLSVDEGGVLATEKDVVAQRVRARRSHTITDAPGIVTDAASRRARGTLVW